MTIPTKRTLRVKHAVGRMLLDTSKLSCDFELEPIEEGWKITIYGIDETIANVIRAQLHEINLFYIEEYNEARSPQKWWLYDRELPSCDFIEDEGKLTMIVDSKVSYTNEKI